MVKGGGDPSCKINPTQKPLYHPILNNTTSHGRGGAASLSSVKLKGKHSKGNGRSINNTALFYTCKFQEEREEERVYGFSIILLLLQFLRDNRFRVFSLARNTTGNVLKLLSVEDLSSTGMGRGRGGREDGWKWDKTDIDVKLKRFGVALLRENRLAKFEQWEDGKK